MALRIQAKSIVMAVVFGVCGAMLGAYGPVGSRLWPPARMAGMPEPTGTQIALLMVVFFFEVVAFSAGLLFLVRGRSILRQLAPESRGWATSAHLAIVWLLVSWVPHDALHTHNGMNLDGLIGIEYTFHITLVLSALVVARFFLEVMRTATPAAASSAGPSGARAAAE